MRKRRLSGHPERSICAMPPFSRTSIVARAAAKGTATQRRCQNAERSERNMFVWCAPAFDQKEPVAVIFETAPRRRSFPVHHN